MNGMNQFDSFEGLVEYIRTFHSFYGDQPYDCGGVIIMFVALLDNMRANEHEILDILPGYLDDAHRELLSRLITAVETYQDN